jgi:adenylate cyclase
MTQPSIAILPFENLSGDPQQDYFGDALSEEIINALTRVQGLLVTARTSSFAFKGKSVTVQDIGSQLGVAHLLEGSFRTAGSRVRITAQLIQVADGFHLWAENFDRDWDDLFALQDEISQQITERVREYTQHFELADHLLAPPAVPPAVYREYLRGRYLLQRFNIADAQAGVRIMKDLSAAHPSFVQAFLGVNYGYTYLGAIGAMPAAEAFGQAAPYLEQALRLAPDSPECLFQRAGMAFWRDWHIPETYRLLQQALQQQPGYADGHLSMGMALAAEGRFEAALKYLDTALKLDPFSVIIHDFKGAVHFFARDYKAAIACFRHCQELDPRFLMAHVNWAAAVLVQGKLEEGLRRFQELPEGGQHDLSILGGTTVAYAMLGDTSKAEAGLRQLTMALEGPVRDRATFFLILTNIALGKHEAALDLLEAGVAARVSILIFLAVEPYFEPLHQYARFQRLIRQVVPDGDFTSTESSSRAAIQTNPADFARLEQWVATSETFRNAQLTLSRLAEEVEMHPNYLSRLINEQSGKNFAEYINTYRLHHFHALANDPVQAQLTLLALAYESGFNSKTVFNTFCKKLSGKTPKALVREGFDKKG